MNWSIALLITSFSILGSGIDQISIKRIAGGFAPGSLMKLYLFHVVVSGLFFCLLLLSGAVLFKEFFRSHYLLITLGLSQFFLYLSMPFKQIATGNERFHILLYMSTGSNIVKAVGVFLLGITGHLSIRLVILVFITGSAIELAVCIYLDKILLKSALAFPLDIRAYKALIRESFPMLGSAIFHSAMARFDWILLGLISTSIVLANYSFAYRVFEISTLPLLALGPLLLPKFTRIFQSRPLPDLLAGDRELLVLLRIEMIVSSFVALALNMLWDPVIDNITGGKYGLVNVSNIFILAACMPFLYLTNFLWTINMAKGRLKDVFLIIMITFLVNVSADILLIPSLQGFGAAIGYLLAIFAQAVLYTTMTRIGSMHKAWESLLLCAGSALLSGLLARHLFQNAGARILLSSCLYILLLVPAGQLRLKDWQTLKWKTGI